jgi:hypothetical protein
MDGLNSSRGYSSIGTINAGHAKARAGTCLFSPTSAHSIPVPVQYLSDTWERSVPLTSSSSATMYSS